MKVLVIGGSKSGKSDFSQEIALSLAQGKKHYYVATMIPGDQEDHNRILSHLKRREGMEFETIEQGLHLLECLEYADSNAVFLIDSVTTLLTNEFFPKEKNYEPDHKAAIRCGKDLLQFADSVAHTVVVSDAIFSDAVRYDTSTDSYRQHLGRIHGQLAKDFDTVLEMTNGNLIVHKGVCPIGGILQ